MTNKEAPIQTTENLEADEHGRRKMAIALLGALGGTAFLSACAQDVVSDADGDRLDQIGQEATGTAIRWADTVLGAAFPAARTGDLATKNSSAIGNAIVVIAKGCVTIGDGGGGIFFWEAGNTSGDDGGTIIVPQPSPAGRWRRIYSGPINVKWFGAKGVGTDDNLAVQNAWTVAKTTKKGLFVPVGAYLTSAPLVFDVHGVNVTGESSMHPGGSVIFNKGTDVITWSGAQQLQMRDICFRATTTNGSVTGPPGGHVIKTTAGTAVGGLLFENVYLLQESPQRSVWSHIGAGMVGAIDFGWNVFIKCKFEHPNPSGVPVLDVVPAMHFVANVVYANQFIDCIAQRTPNTTSPGGQVPDDYALHYFFHFESSAGFHNNNVLKGVTFETPSGGAVKALGAYGLLVEDCLIADLALGPAIYNDLIFIGKSAAGLDSFYVTVRNTHRPGSPGPTDGLQDVRIGGSGGLDGKHILENLTAGASGGPLLLIDCGGITTTILGCRATVTNQHATASVRIEAGTVQVGSDVTLDRDPGAPDLRVSGGIRLGGSTGARIQRVWYGTAAWNLGTIANGQVVSIAITVTGLPSYSSPGINLMAIPQIDGNASSMESGVLLTALPNGSDGVIVNLRNDSGGNVAFGTRTVRVAVFQL